MYIMSRPFYYTGQRVKGKLQVKKNAYDHQIFSLLFKEKQNPFDINVLGPFYAKPHLLLGPHLETSKILGKSWKYFSFNYDSILIYQSGIYLKIIKIVMKKH